MRACVHGMACRDIKCSNILVDKSGTIKLADFGLAKHYSASLDMTGCRGTVWWMAPEVINASVGYNWAVDIWQSIALPGCKLVPTPLFLSPHSPSHAIFPR
ncbi:unnamed protein product [Closterium sp. NIES-53]